MLLSQVKISNVALPKCAADGYTVTKNKLWSKNTGRTASGSMVGDIIATKYSISLKWNELTQAQVTTIENAISASSFFAVIFQDEKGAQKTGNFYAADMTYPVKVQRNGATIYKGVTLEIIEQ